MNICEYEGKTRGEDTYFNWCMNIPFSRGPSPSGSWNIPRGEMQAAQSEGPVAPAPRISGNAVQWKGVCSGGRPTRFKSLSHGKVRCLNKIFNLGTSEPCL